MLLKMSVIAHPAINKQLPAMRRMVGILLVRNGRERIIELLVINDAASVKIPTPIKRMQAFICLHSLCSGWSGNNIADGKNFDALFPRSGADFYHIANA